MKILAIETSCDETAMAVLECSGSLAKPKFKILKNVVSSEILIHRPFGGVVPNLAKREHLNNLPIVYRQVFGNEKEEAKLWNDIDLVTVTVAPGLEPALWTGIEFAKMISKEHHKPIIGANHLHGHLYSFLLPDGKSAKTAKFQDSLPGIFPAIALIVSGGHTILLKLDSFSKWRHLGETRDDAAGEAFDKVARMLGLPYPGGPEVEKLSHKGNPNAIIFPRPMINEKNFDFSFSGLKTAVLYYCRDHPGFNKADVAASFQAAAINILIHKTIRAATDLDARTVILCGGVAANQTLRKTLEIAVKKIGANFFVPPFGYNLDNAAMIGAAGYMAYLRRKKYPLEARGNKKSRRPTSQRQKKLSVSRERFARDTRL